MAVLVLLHLIGVIVWVGGMLFALVCLRPAAMTLAPPVRLPLMLDALGRFFGLVIGAVLLIWASGLALISVTGLTSAPPGWHLMIAAGVVMTVLFGWIRAQLLPRARRALAAGELPRAAVALESIRRLVIVNLALGILAIVAVKLLV